jgi:hypothetical protein
VNMANLTFVQDYLRYTVSVAGRELRCQYWPGPAGNATRVIAKTAVLPGDRWQLFKGRDFLSGQPLEHPELAVGAKLTLNIYFNLATWEASRFNRPADSPFECFAQATPLFDARYQRVLPEISQAVVDQLRQLLWTASYWPHNLLSELAIARAGVLGAAQVRRAAHAAATAAEAAGVQADNPAQAFSGTAARLTLELAGLADAAPTRGQLLGTVVDGSPIEGSERSFERQVFDQPLQVGDKFWSARGVPYLCTAAGSVEGWSQDRIDDEDEFVRSPGKYQTVRGVRLAQQLVEFTPPETQIPRQEND